MITVNFHLLGPAALQSAFWDPELFLGHRRLDYGHLKH
ncbi:rCG49444 [Rattus norvegicus]|uniref:RCG49444 n=1 Tax=Rattus norvegicus TaxID=10116 RepID=A6J3H2_RAT|nr:rCG49444 [Rattus norvegicus]